MITGINHITLSVRDIGESLAFYTGLLGFQPVARWLTGAYLLGGDLWVALQQEEAARTEPLPEYTHIAFSVAPADFAAVAERIRASGAVIWQENRSEGASLYFLDPNGHKLEIHASDLAARLRSVKENPWAGIEFFL